MLFCDLTLPTPEENLAFDEALLDMCEAGFSGPVLRFWAPETRFVVVGYANKVALEVNADACRDRNIPILRRCTGGGTVLQGPGCLNYSVVLRIDSDPQLGGIPGTNKYVMERNREAVQTLLEAPVQLEGHTDLAVGGLKFCGNAQRRRRHCLIFHGCFLLACDIALMEEVLFMPSKRPEYRNNRRHGEFVTNIAVSPAALIAALKAVWNAARPLTECPLAETQVLAREKYSRAEWNLKF